MSMTNAEYMREWRKAHPGYQKEWDAAHPEKRRAYQQAYKAKKKVTQAAYYERNKDRLNARTAERRRANPEKYNARVRAYKRANRAKENALWSKRDAQKLRACPPWARRDPRIAALYEIAAWLRAQGDDVHVDHIFPLRPEHPDAACGLHVFANLRIIDAGLNIRKQNSQPTPAALFCQSIVLQTMNTAIGIL